MCENGPTLQLYITNNKVFFRESFEKNSEILTRDGLKLTLSRRLLGY